MRLETVPVFDLLCFIKTGEPMTSPAFEAPSAPPAVFSLSCSVSFICFSTSHFGSEDSPKMPVRLTSSQLDETLIRNVFAPGVRFVWIAKMSSLVESRKMFVPTCLSSAWTSKTKFFVKFPLRSDPAMDEHFAERSGNWDRSWHDGCDNWTIDTKSTKVYPTIYHELCYVRTRKYRIISNRMTHVSSISRPWETRLS